MFNSKLNAARDYVKAANCEQRNLYQALKDKTKSYYQKVHMTLDDPVKGYTANKASDHFRIAHDRPINDKFMGYSPSGMQSVKYDILNPSKAEKSASTYSDLYRGTILLNKNTPISGYVDKANINQVHS